MLTFILLFAFSFALTKLKKEDGSDAPEICDPDFGTEYKYIKVSGNPLISLYYPLNVCTKTDEDENHIYEPCTETSYKLTRCYENGTISDDSSNYNLKKNTFEKVMSSYSFIEIAYGNNSCSGNKLSVAYFNDVYLDNGDGTLIKYVQDGTKAFVHLYNATTKEFITKEEAEIVCGCLEDDDNYSIFFGCNLQDNCDPEIMEQQFKYLTKTENGIITVIPLSKPIKIDGTVLTLEACSATHVQKKISGENGYIVYTPLLELGMDAYATELPAHVVKAVEYSETQCGENKETGMMVLLTNECIKEETGEGAQKTTKYYKVTQNGAKITMQYYSEPGCAEDKKVTGEGSTDEIECGKCDEKMKYECPDEGVTCEANFETDKKFAYIGADKLAAVELNKCFDFTVDQQVVKMKYVPCTETHVEIVPCEGTVEGSTEKLPLEGGEYVTELKAHVSYSYVYSDDQCSKQGEYVIVLLTTDCVKEEDKYYKNGVDGNKVVEKTFSDADCSKPIENGESTIECDKCVSEEGVHMKFVCHEFGKENGAMNTFLLLVLALIFFMF